MFEVKQIKSTEKEALSKFEKVFNPPWYIKPFRWIRHIYRNISYTIKNLICWLPIIWKDREWDYYYLTTILLRKLKNMRDYYAGGVNVWSADAQKTADQITEVIDLLEKVEADNYEEAIDPHFNDWVYNKINNLNDFIKKDSSENLTWNGPDWTEEEYEHRRKVYKTAEENLQADLDKAYSLIAKNIRGWWD